MLSVCQQHQNLRTRDPVWKVCRGLGKTVQTIAFLSALLGKCGVGGGPHPEPGRDPTIKCAVATLPCCQQHRALTPVRMQVVILYALRLSLYARGFSWVGSTLQGDQSCMQPMRAAAHPHRLPFERHVELAAGVFHLG
jgi:hypothetical protein